MNTGTFRKARREAIGRLKALYASTEKGSYDEQALPAYVVANPMANRMFWRRIRIVSKIIESLETQEVGVDFGSGLGIMLPYIKKRARQVIAIDRESEKLCCGIKALNIKIPDLIISREIGTLLPLYRNKVGIILAMDVLEHIEEPSKAIDSIWEMLKPNGILIVTGPTENAIYRLGRRLVGFSGLYHCRDIYEIRNILGSKFSILSNKRIYKLCPFFQVMTLKSKSIII